MFRYIPCHFNITRQPWIKEGPHNPAHEEPVPVPALVPAFVSSTPRLSCGLHFLLWHSCHPIFIGKSDIAFLTHDFCFRVAEYIRGAAVPSLYLPVDISGNNSKV